MADLIDRIELRKDFCNMCEAMQPEMIDCEKKGRMSMQIIDEQTAVNRWIPVSERLPEKSGLYLTYQKELGRFQLMRYSPVLRNCTGWFDDNYGLYVTHWMPLPEPPEKE